MGEEGGGRRKYQHPLHHLILAHLAVRNMRREIGGGGTGIEDQGATRPEEETGGGEGGGEKEEEGENLKEV